MAEDIRGRRGHRGLGEAEDAVAEGGQGAARPPLKTVTPASDDLMPL